MSRKAKLVTDLLNELDGTFTMNEIVKVVRERLGPKIGESIIRRAVRVVATKNGTKRATTWTFGK